MKQRFEYNVVQCHPTVLAATLNVMATQGWQAICVSPIEGDYGYRTLVFERPKILTTEEVVTTLVEDALSELGDNPSKK